SADDPIYKNTRNFVLSTDNPYFYRGTTGEGIGGPHSGHDMVWPMSITMRALTSDSPEEIRWCIEALRKTHGGTGFMHESFHKDDPTKFTRAWSAWSNTLYRDLSWKVYTNNRYLLS